LTPPPDLPPGYVWGYTKKDWERYDPKTETIPPPHLFRDGRRLCPTVTPDGQTRKEQFGYLFISLKNFDATVEDCCQECLRRLAIERFEEQAKA
jgi:hypothetical protein